jgi:hypothetical protein
MQSSGGRSLQLRAQDEEQFELSSPYVLDDTPNDCGAANSTSSYRL